MFAGDKLDLAVGIARERHANARQENILINRKARVVVDLLKHDHRFALRVGDRFSPENAACHFIGNGHQILGFNTEPGYKTAFTRPQLGDTRAVG